MKFSEIEYVQLDFEVIKEQYINLIKELKETKTCEEALNVVSKINALDTEFSSYGTLASIRNSIDTSNEKYEKAQEFFDEVSPQYQDLATNYYRVLISLPFKDELKEKLGDLLFNQIDLSLKTFKPEIIEDLIEENKLSTEYSKLIASAKIEFDGKVLNLSQMAPYGESLDRNVRREANLARGKWFYDHMNEFDEIYDKMVKVRTRMAKKLGYENYVQLGFDKLGRTDYTPADVKNYREQIKETLVPIAQELLAKQIKRIGVENPLPYDYNLNFLSGNAKPIGTTQEKIENAKKMYDELSSETSSFFRFLVEHELMDLETKPNKQGGGYCTYIPKFKMPFIFSNFNGTSGDVDVLTHEFGHSFQVYSSKDIPIPEYIWPTMEACEIHSMSMEFFAYPWMNLFFGKDEEKYKYTHLKGAITFVPYGACVDEFQTYVYENYEATPKQRREKWLELHKQYEPHLKFDELEYYKEGLRWFAQAHIFNSPFYYIDYTLAQVCAFQFKNMMDVDKEKAWDTYVKLCKLGGSKSFLNLLKEVGLKNPFLDGCIASVMKPLQEKMNSIDDTKF